MARAPVNIAASVRARLRNLARAENKVFQTLLVAFGLERLIYRLSISDHKDQFVLKGGMLVTLWTVDEARFTRDVDFLKFGAADEDRLIDIFRETLAIDADDGLIYDTDNITATSIREDQIYGGIRLRTQAALDGAIIPITIDIGFGDALTRPDYLVEYPSLLDFPDTTIRAYSPATVMAEKFQAIVALGLVNGRMKDYYDLWAIPRAETVNDDDIIDAISATFERRSTSIPSICPDGLSASFSADADKQRQWAAYAASIEFEQVSLSDVTEDIWKRLEPICKRAASK